jgi:hypothetical protein
MLFRDPVFVPESGNTNDRSALETFWTTSGRRARDPLTNRDLSSRTVFVNWDKRREVASWLSAHPAHVPAGWAGRDDIPPAEGTRRHPLASRGWWRLPGVPGVSGRGLALAVVIVLSTASGLGVQELVWPESLWRAPGPEDAQPLWATDLDAPDAPVRHQQPLGSRLAVRERVGPPRVLSVYLPRARLGEVRLSSLASAAFTLGFTTVWTLGAHAGGAPLPFALFSAPFWFVGGQLLSATLAPLLEATGLALHADFLEVRSDSFLGPRMLRLPYSDITDLGLAVGAVLNDSPELVLAIVAGLETVSWGFGLAPAELQWVCRLARSFLAELDAPDAAAAPPGSAPRHEQPPSRFRPELVERLRASDHQRECEISRAAAPRHAHPYGGVHFDVGFGF